MDKHKPALEFAKSAIGHIEMAIRNAKKALFAKVYDIDGYATCFLIKLHNF